MKPTNATERQYFMSRGMLFTTLVAVVISLLSGCFFKARYDKKKIESNKTEITKIKNERDKLKAQLDFIQESALVFKKNMTEGEQKLKQFREELKAEEQGLEVKKELEDLYRETNIYLGNQLTGVMNLDSNKIAETTISQWQEDIINRQNQLFELEKLYGIINDTISNTISPSNELELIDCQKQILTLQRRLNNAENSHAIHLKSCNSANKRGGTSTSQPCPKNFKAELDTVQSKLKILVKKIDAEVFKNKKRKKLIVPKELVKIQDALDACQCR